MTPFSVRLHSFGRASDAAYLAAADITKLAADLQMDYRLVGGNAVTLLVAAHGVTTQVPGRETADADLGLGHRIVADPRLLPALVVRR